MKRKIKLLLLGFRGWFFKLIGINSPSKVFMITREMQERWKNEEKN
jgi:hypothetical protein